MDLTGGGGGRVVQRCSPHLRNLDLGNFELDLIVNDRAASSLPALPPPVGQDPVGGALHQVLQGDSPSLVVPCLRGDSTLWRDLFEEGPKIADLVVNASKISHHD